MFWYAFFYVYHYNAVLYGSLMANTLQVQINLVSWIVATARTMYQDWQNWLHKNFDLIHCTSMMRFVCIYSSPYLYYIDLWCCVLSAFYFCYCFVVISHRSHWWLTQYDCCCSMHRSAVNRETLHSILGNLWHCRQTEITVCWNKRFSSARSERMLRNCGKVDVWIVVHVQLSAVL